MKANVICTVAEAEKILGFDLLETLLNKGLNFKSNDEIEIVFREGYIIVWDDMDGETLIDI